MSDVFDLNRFMEAQDVNYQVALNEILNGKKLTHWIWYVFPQGPFGGSAASIRYSLKSVSEAIAYIQTPTLRNRLLEITTAVSEQLERGLHPKELMGSSIDCQKLASSMTLFRYTAENQGDQDLINAISQTLDLIAACGWGECSKTMNWIRNQ